MSVQLKAFLCVYVGTILVMCLPFAIDMYMAGCCWSP